jgi:protein-disulfide isomerase
MPAIPRKFLTPPVNTRDHAIGQSNAEVTLVEYGDFQCPHCARAHEVVKLMRVHLGDGMNFVFRNFPMTHVHPEALRAAEAAESVAAHAGNVAYWAMHDALFAHQQDGKDALDDAHLIAYAGADGADPERVRAELTAGTHEMAVRADYISGLRSGVRGTPTFFINGCWFDGDWSDIAAFERALRDVELVASPPVRSAPQLVRDTEGTRVAEEIASRLHALGVMLTGDESGEELADLLEAVEYFEEAVESRGGDLMVDEPIGAEPPIQPDAAAFVLPPREVQESVGAYLQRIDLARRVAETVRLTGVLGKR